MNDKYVLDLTTERTVVEWKNGKIYCSEYNLENERIALALIGGQGRGMNVLLLALEDLRPNKATLGGLIERFNKEYKIHKDGSSREHDLNSALLFTYYSYSPDSYTRWVAATYGELRNKTWQRLMQDPFDHVAAAASIKYDHWTPRDEPFVDNIIKGNRNILAIALAYNLNLPEQYLLKIASHPERDVRIALLERKNMPLEVALALARQDNGEKGNDLLAWCKRAKRRGDIENGYLTKVKAVVQGRKESQVEL